MDSAVWALIGSAFGAITTGVFSEYYKRYRDTRALAYAIAGDVGYRVRIMRELRADTSIEAIIEYAKAGMELTMPELPDVSDLVFEKNIEKLGLLEGELPGRVVSTYGLFSASRHNLLQIIKGRYGTTGPVLAAVMQSNYDIWRKQIAPACLSLEHDLLAVARRGLWSTLLHSAWPGPIRYPSIPGSWRRALRNWRQVKSGKPGDVP